MSDLLEIAGLRIAILNYERPSADEYWDANWLLCDVTSVTDNARVSAGGPILRTDELSSFLNGLSRMSRLETTEAVLETVEGALTVRLRRSGALGTVTMEAGMRTQSGPHRMTFATDLPAVDGLRRGLDAAMTRFPIRFADSGDQYAERSIKRTSRGDYEDVH